VAATFSAAHPNPNRRTHTIPYLRRRSKPRDCPASKSCGQQAVGEELEKGKKSYHVTLKELGRREGRGGGVIGSIRKNKVETGLIFKSQRL